MKFIKINDGHYVIAHTITEVKVEGREDQPQVKIRVGHDEDMLLYRAVPGNSTGTGFAKAYEVAAGLVREIEEATGDRQWGWGPA